MSALPETTGGAKANATEENEACAIFGTKGTRLGDAAALVAPSSAATFKFAEEGTEALAGTGTAKDDAAARS
jgi:hypothetical protein